jgi:cbb3-type cytochrome oxidase cytochrome c subunit
MKCGPLVFLAALIALSASWGGFVIAPQLQVGSQQQTNTVGTAETYPLARPGLAHQGEEIYRANGCTYCHSQQIVETAPPLCDLVLTDAGTNRAALLEALATINKDLANTDLGAVPKTILKGASREAADTAMRLLRPAKATVELDLKLVGPDIARGWGKRRTVARDFLYDYPVMLGSQRIGPDLADVGARRPDPNWQLRHLYAPQADVNDSTMPSFRFLFERRKIDRQPSPDALQFQKEFAPPPGIEIVPKPEAKALVAYLLSLRADAPLFVTPMNPPPMPATSTNSPATTNAPPAVPQQ